MKATARIFLSYARQDEEKVEKLYQKLSDAGFRPWMDKKDILPGERWESSIRRAVRRSDFFLACLSANSVSKRGWIQREIKNALDMWQEKLDSDIYLIPVRLEDCEVPESLDGFQWVDLFEEDGWTRLVKAIQVGIERRAEVIKSDAQESASVSTKDTLVRYEILELLYEAYREAYRISALGHMRLKTLIERLNTSPETVQFHLDYLEKQGYVALSRRPQGVRIVRYYSITQKGMDSVERGLVSSLRN